jgi:hypothetical protein
MLVNKHLPIGKTELTEIGLDILEEERTILLEELATLEQSHRDLDIAIRSLAQQVYIDQFQMQRLKRQKLGLKDKIARIKSRLIPDMPA